jgi:hypothetical protein
VRIPLDQRGTVGHHGGVGQPPVTDGCGDGVEVLGRSDRVAPAEFEEGAGESVEHLQGDARVVGRGQGRGVELAGAPQVADEVAQGAEHRRDRPLPVSRL